MTDRILSEAEIIGIEKGSGSWIEHGSRVYPLHVIKELTASHRLLQRRAEKLEGLLEHVTGEVPR